jgi:hydrogenase assembly chaperone HypC/HupF
MCLGIPGEVVAGVAGTDQLALVDVLGVRREVNVGMLDALPSPGQWVLIHSGFALAVVTEEEAAEALAGLELVGRPAADVDSWDDG